MTKDDVTTTARPTTSETAQTKPGNAMRHASCVRASASEQDLNKMCITQDIRTQYADTHPDNAPHPPAHWRITTKKISRACVHRRNVETLAAADSGRALNDALNDAVNDALNGALKDALNVSSTTH